jgi:hypothetical protein
MTMNIERRSEISEGARPADVSDGEGPRPDEATVVRDQGLTLLDEADRAINRALSRDSSRFLAQGRQTGGQ